MNSSSVAIKKCSENFTIKKFFLGGGDFEERFGSVKKKDITFMSSPRNAINSIGGRESG